MQTLFEKFKKFFEKQQANQLKPPVTTKLIELNPINYNDKIINEFNKKINDLFINLIYKPLGDVLKNYDILLNYVANSENDIMRAIEDGKIIFTSNGFQSNLPYKKFPSLISKTLMNYGAKYNPRNKTFEITFFALPSKIQNTILQSTDKTNRLLQETTEVLNLATNADNFDKKFDNIKFEKTYEKILFDVKSQIAKNIEEKNIDIPIELTSEQEKQIVKNYTENLKLTIKNFTDKQILELREMVEENTKAGYRPEVLAKKIQERFTISKVKAEFLADQETRLLTTQYTMLTFTEGNIIDRFKWGRSFSRIPDEYHQTLYDKLYRFDDLPIIDEKTQEKGLPGQRFNCKCRIIPVIEELI